MSQTQRFFGVVAVSAVLSIAGCDPTPSSSSTAVDSPRGIVLISLDGLIPGQLSAFGGETPTPGFEALVADSSVWIDAWTAVPMTRPAVSTLLTGIAPDRHGVRDDLFTALPAETPTLATELSELGFRTAAFPDSWFLGGESGLLRGFDVVADPPSFLVTPARWLPHNREATEIVEEFDDWLTSVAEDERFFAWVHFSGLLKAQIRTIDRRFAPAIKGEPEAEVLPRTRVLSNVDAALLRLLESLDRHPAGRDTLLILVSTSGAHCVVGSGTCGPGFSLSEAALRAPVVLRWPAETSRSSRTGSLVWSPDVAATIADVAGLTLSDRAEGVSLYGPAEDRTVFAWSWAAQDQLGWKALRAVRDADSPWVEGSSAVGADGGDALLARLAERAEPARKTVPLDVVAPILQSLGIDLRPIPSEGRDFGDPAVRRAVTGLVTAARLRMKSGDARTARAAFRKVLEIDPNNLASSLDLGQILTASDVSRAEARQVLAEALSRYPTDPGLLHWYGHAIWNESLDEAERLLEALLPYTVEAPDVLYDLACARSIAGDLERSADFLRRSIEAGYRDWGHMETDADLRELRTSGRYAEVLQDYQ